MNNFLQKDVKTYVRDLISETFDTMAEDTRKHDKLRKEGQPKYSHYQPKSIEELIARQLSNESGGFNKWLNK